MDLTLGYLLALMFGFITQGSLEFSDRPSALPLNGHMALKLLKIII